MQAGANFTNILELTFKQQIFMIFIVEKLPKLIFLNQKTFNSWTILLKPVFELKSLMAFIF